MKIFISFLSSNQTYPKEPEGIRGSEEKEDMFCGIEP